MAVPLTTAWPGVHGSVLLLSIILLASLGTGLLFVLSLVAAYRRRSRRYVVIAVAVGALFTRSVVGIGTVSGAVPMVVHHGVEHSFDFLIAVLILLAIYESAPSHLESPADD